MYKKLRLFSFSLLGTILLTSQSAVAQDDCGTRAPGDAWDSWFNKQVEKFKLNYMAGKTNQVKYTIPVVVHVINAGEATGTFPNIAQTQVASQIQVLNEDFNALGSGIANCPSQFTNVIGNTGLEFCLAITNPQGIVLPEQGIDRINVTVNSWQSPTTPTIDLKTYFLNTIMPGSIWDPTKYLNIWVSDKPASNPIKGFATYPSGTGLTGLFGTAADFGTTGCDGVWVWASAFGNTGNVIAPNDKGRIATHEIGHWLGLRHIWGDGNCLSDYVADTPTAKDAHTGCETTTPVDQCGVSSAPFGEMPMNFMDRTKDNCMYMFTKDQNLRIQTAMSMCTNRNLLGSHSICTITPASASVAALASFTLQNIACLNTPVTAFNTTNGYPNPTYVWSASPSASFIPSTTAPNPSIKFSAPGQYTVTMVATNSVNSSSYSMAVTVLGSSCTPGALCQDSIKMVKVTDTLHTYRALNNPLIMGCQNGWAGYATGTNCYKDKAFAQFYPNSSYQSVPYPQVNSVIVFFDTLGTKGNPATQITCKIYGGTVGGGPGSAVMWKSDSLGKIINTARTSTISYLAVPGFTPVHLATPTKIIPFKFDMPQPANVNWASGFFAGVEAPYLTPSDSINIFSNTGNNNSVDSSAWLLQFNNTWRTFRYNRKVSNGKDIAGNEITIPARIQLAIIPQITCSQLVGVKEASRSAFDANVAVVPNPNNGKFNLVFTLPAEMDVNFSVYNALGQKISQGNMSNVRANVFEMDMSDQPNGVYFANVNNGAETVVRKIVVNH